MKARDRLRAQALDAALTQYSARVRPLAGIADAVARGVFLEQLIDSLHRVEYPRRLLGRDVSPRRADPADAAYFDPIRAAIHHARNGDHDEACWLVFLFVAYGKGKRTGWQLIRDVYGRPGQGGRWDWPTASADPRGFDQWVVAHAGALWPPGTARPFGAHRQRESVAPSGRSGATYVAWIGAAGHRDKFARAAGANGGDRRRTFDALYHDMNAVYRFGRLARFDYVAMLGKLDLAPVEPGSTYMVGATGPVDGARLFFENDPEARVAAAALDAQLADLDARLGVGMQALEDALCNWQKSPRRYKPFTG